MALCAQLGRYFPPDFTVESDQERIDTIVRNYMDSGEFVRLDNPRPYCLAVMAMTRPWISHFGMVLSKPYRFVHVYREGIVAVDRLDSALWSGRIAGYWEHKTWQTT